MTMELMDIFYIIFGLIIGSFLNVCIYRIPASREELYPESPYAQNSDVTPISLSIGSPRHSICPYCRHKLKWWHNIPVVSWIILRGRCANCETAISARYPLVEILTGAFAYLSFSSTGINATSMVLFLFCASLIVISFIDYDYFIIPNVISYPGTIIGIVIAIVNQQTGIFEPPIVQGVVPSLLGILVGAGFLYIVAQFYLKVRKIEGLGMGDVKLLAMTGALLGPQASFYTIFVGSVLGSIGGISLILLTKRKASQHIPFGPYLATATLLYIFTGDLIIKWWVGLIVGAPGGDL